VQFFQGLKDIYGQDNGQDTGAKSTANATVIKQLNLYSRGVDAR
jgi:hypothetical protein